MLCFTPGWNISSTNHTHFHTLCAIKPARLKDNTIILISTYYLDDNKLLSLSDVWLRNGLHNTMTRRATFVTVYLKDVLCVVHAVDPDVVLQRGAVRVREEHQPQALGSPHMQGLSNQSKGAQLLREKSARLGLKLAVIGLRHQLFPHQQDVLEEVRWT